MGDDVVQLAGDPRSLGEQRLLAPRRGMGGDARVAFRDDRAAAAQQRAEAERGDRDDEHEEAPSAWVVPVERCGRVDQERAGDHRRGHDAEVERRRAQHEHHRDHTCHERRRVAVGLLGEHGDRTDRRGEARESVDERNRCGRADGGRQRRVGLLTALTDDGLADGDHQQHHGTCRPRAAGCRRGSPAPA